MAVTIMRQENAGSAGGPPALGGESLSVLPLADEYEAETLVFLAARPLHTVFLASLIRDNGLVSTLNRGTFYGCRNAAGRLNGVALIGHATLVETDHATALQAFARLTQQCPNAYLIRGEQARVEQFWHYYAAAQCRQPRRSCRELLMEQRPPVTVHEPVRGLRPARPDDLPQLMGINAELLEAECGVNPLLRDPIGFRVRLLRRIEQGRVWVWAQQGQVRYKTEVLAETPEVAYLEGVWVHPELRGRGFGLRCLSELGRMLLTRVETVCLIVNAAALGTQAFYHKIGYRPVGLYDTIYLQPQAADQSPHADGART